MENSKRDRRYLQFPLMMLKGVHENFYDGMQQILKYAIVDFALKSDVSEDDCARQFIYNLLRGGGLKEMVTEYHTVLRCDYPENYEEIQEEFLEKGNAIFGYDKDKKEYVLEEVLGLFNENPELKSLARINCQLHKVYEFFNVNGLHIDIVYSGYKIIHRNIQSQEDEFGRDPYPTILIDLFFDMYQKNEKDLFCMYMGLRSLMGKLKFTETTGNTIAMRYLGAKSRGVLGDYLTKSAVMIDLYDKITRSQKSRRHFLEKYLGKLINRKLIKKISYGGRIYLSCSMSGEELESAIVGKINKRRMVVQAKNESAARKRLKQILTDK